MKKLLLTLTLALVACGGGGYSTQDRKDLLYGYYGTYGEQVAEVKDQTNLHWEAFFQGDEVAFANIAQADKFTVLDLGRIWERTSPVQLALRDDAAQVLRGLFDTMRARQLLGKVRMVVPIDEPNLPENQVCSEVENAVLIIRAVAGEYSELEGVKVGVIFYVNNNQPFCTLAPFDVLGFDKYSEGDKILRKGGRMDQLLDALRSDQRAMLVPGGSYGQVPEPFMQYAEQHSQVWMVIPFLWWYPDHGETIPSIRDMPLMREAYTAAGRSVVQ